MNKTEDEVKSAAVHRRVRPSFADDVYASDELSLSYQTIQNTTTSISHMELCESALAQRRSAQLPKLKEISQQPFFENADLSMNLEMNDLDFVYADCDTHGAELSELYTYSEIEDWAHNIHSYKNYVEAKKLDLNWSLKSNKEQRAIFLELIERLENVDTNIRLDAARVILYILQGAYIDFAEEEKNYDRSDTLKIENLETKDESNITEYEEKCLSEGILNSYKAYEAGVFQALCAMLMVEINDPWDTHALNEVRHSQSSSVSNSRSASNVDLSENVERRNRKSATIADNESLRVVLSSIYHMVESIRRIDVFDIVVPSERKDYYGKLRTEFLTELDEPLDHAGLPLLIILFEMMHAFCHGSSPHFPMKKVLLLTWKILLAVHGGWKVLRETKAKKRNEAKLNDVEDTLVVATVMKASIINGTESEQSQGIARLKRLIHTHAPNRLICRQLACTSSDSLETKSDYDMDPTLQGKSNEQDKEGVKTSVEDSSVEDCETSLPIDSCKEELQINTPVNKDTKSFTVSTRNSINPLLSRSSYGDRTPIAITPPPMDVLFKSSLPWRPKVREEDIETFLQYERFKFFNYRIPGDITTVFALPRPIQNSVDVLKRYLYVSLSDLQAKRDKELNRYLFSQREFIDNSKAEKLYSLMLPNLSKYVIALIKVLLAAVPSSKAKSDAINILSDLLTPETNSNEVLSNSINLECSLTNVLEQSVRIAIDINRHKEIMVKAASSILILLMKHFRLNHIYQFEYISQHLVFANSIPLIVKFLDQNMVRYVQSKHELPPYNYPHAPVYFVKNQEEWPILTMDNVEDAESRAQGYYLWRNVFSTLNLLRVLNKLTKWKHSRTMLLVVFKSAPILKRSLRVKLAVFQLYVLKLLKMQARYLGRQWRRSNMEIMSAIYSKVRHRLNDDWAYANETRSKSWDFQSEEASLKIAVEKFNSRRYSHLYPVFAIEPGESPSPGCKYLDSIDLREFEPVDNNFLSVLGHTPEMSDRFKSNYEKWVNSEVENQKVDWDQLISHSYATVDTI